MGITADELETAVTQGDIDTVEAAEMANVAAYVTPEYRRFSAAGRASEFS